MAAKLHHLADERLQKLQRGLALEEEESRARAEALTSEATPKQLEERGLLLKKAKVIEQRPTLLGRVRVTLVDDQNRPGHVDRFDARPGAAVSLLERDDEGRPVAAGHGVVARRRRGTIEVVFDGTDAAKDVDVDDAIDLLRGEDEITLRRLKEGLARARNCTGRSARLVEVLLGVTPPRPTRMPDDFAALGLSPELNADQQRAAAHGLLAEDVALVHGPPGTGKTRVLVDVVTRAVLRGERVLALTASNAAIDHLAISLLQADPKLSLARLGDPARVSEALEDHTLAQLTESHPHRLLAKELVEQALGLLRGARRRSDRGREAFQREREARVEAGKLFAEARRLERLAARAVLDRTRVLCGTLTGRLDDLLGEAAEDAFDVVVVDEASQALTPAILLGALHANRIVLAGDHLQLPPVVMSMAALKAGLGKTVFSELCAKDDGGSVSHMLTVQHRMHEEIMRFPSRSWYEGKLVAHASVASSTLKLGAGAREGVSRPEVVFEVADTAGAGFEEQSPPESDSKSNPGEAVVVGLIVRDLIAGGLSPGDVGVITPYSAQAALLGSNLSDLVDLGLEVDSVDGFQGREKVAIVFSAVRSNPDATVGFLADERRLNVALTRAKKKLIVVGDSATLSSDATWRSLFDDAIARCVHRSVFEIEGAVG
ncbi:MAG: AAA domain-containing protein [Deltaproteobacteria bacterium]|nr:AAA domain-containing protein [Deltaproteobacteria bacterium]